MFRKNISLNKKKLRDVPLLSRESYLASNYSLSERTSPSLETLNYFSENVFGSFKLSQSIVCGGIINGKQINFPLVTEEKTVVSAINKAFKIFNICGGIKSYHDHLSIMTGQVFYANLTDLAFEQFQTMLIEKKFWIETSLEKKSLVYFNLKNTHHGGLLGDFRLIRLNDSSNFSCSQYVLEFDMNVGEAMGAKIIIDSATCIAVLIKEHFQINYYMAICSNNSNNRKSYASIELNYDLLKTEVDLNAFQHIQLASEAAISSKNRAITHNKGIMNGVIALALATGQDTRALESAIHFFCK